MNMQTQIKAKPRRVFGSFDQTVTVYRGDDELELEVTYNVNDGEFELFTVEHNDVDFDETSEEHDQIMDQIMDNHDWSDDGGRADYEYDRYRERDW